MKIVLIGPSGAGKGSLAEFIVRDYGIVHISTGQIFRENIANKTALGIEAEKFIDEGLFVPDEITVKMLLERLGAEDCKKGFILDGFPRTINQAKLLDENFDVDLVVEIDASDETVMSRLGGRYMCRECDAIHNSRNDDLRKCKGCGAEGKFYQRDDDREEKILKRLQQYHDQSGPVLDYYRGKGAKRALFIRLESRLEDTSEDLYRKFSEACGTL